MFSQTLIDALVAESAKEGLEPAAALALVEVETLGVTFEQDGRTPQLLYERHIAWRQAAKVSRRLQSAFALAGLAIPKWSRSTQYKDEGNSGKRLALIGRARAVDEEVANRSASWGVGQTMGFLYAELGFASACAMVDHMTGNLAGQIECLFRALKSKHLIEPLNKHEWAVVGRVYNGDGYAANRYDVRLGDAYKRWVRKLALPAPDRAHPAPNMAADEIKAAQAKLRKLGYAAVGQPDGVAGTKFVAACAQFQKHEGLLVTGAYDEATRAALQTAVAIEQPRARTAATANDLADAGSKTIKAAKAGNLFSAIKGFVGSIFVGGGIAEKMDVFGAAQGAIDKANQAKGIWQSFCDLAQPLFAGPTPIVAGGVLIALAVGSWFLFEQIKAYRVADHNSGAHAGPSNETGE